MLAGIVAILPFVYHRYFAWKASPGLEELLPNDNEINEEENIHFHRSLRRGDPGFRQIIKAVRNFRSLSGRPISINFVRGRHGKDVAKYTGIYWLGNINPLSILYIEYPDETENQIVIYRPYQQYHVKLEVLESWVMAIADRNGRKWTALFAVLWTTIAFLLLLT